MPKAFDHFCSESSEPWVFFPRETTGLHDFFYISSSAGFLDDYFRAGKLASEDVITGAEHGLFIAREFNQPMVRVKILGIADQPCFVGCRKYLPCNRLYALYAPSNAELIAIILRGPALARIHAANNAATIRKPRKCVARPNRRVAEWCAS
jgi:hypothetical protein